MENFQNDDEKGRKIFKEFCQQQIWCKVHKTSKDKFAKWDLSFFSGRTQMIGEIKVRDYNSRDFDNWYLEADKLDALRKLNEVIPNSRITYINHFKDNITYIWDLTELKETELDYSMQNLQINDYTTQTKLKKVIHLPHHIAIKFETNEKESIFNK